MELIVFVLTYRCPCGLSLGLWRLEEGELQAVRTLQELRTGQGGGIGHKRRRDADTGMAYAAVNNTHFWPICRHPLGI